MAFIGTNSLLQGSKVKHRITEEEGILIAKFYVISGCCELWIQSKEPKPEGGFRDFYCSSELVEVLDEKAFPCEHFKEESPYDFAQEVEIPHLGVKGTITSFCFFMTNADHVEVQPPYNHQESLKPKAISVATKLIKPIDGKALELGAGANRSSPSFAPTTRDLTTRN